MSKWTPKIVGGTDYGDEPIHKPSVDSQGPLNFDFSPSPNKEIIETTHEWLSDYVNTIPEPDKVTWDYGPITAVRDGVRMQRGQYVKEFHDYLLHKTYWIPC